MTNKSKVRSVSSGFNTEINSPSSRLLSSPPMSTRYYKGANTVAMRLVSTKCFTGEVEPEKKQGQSKLLLSLPGDLILACLEFGDVKLAINFAQTCSTMKKLIMTKESNLLWEELISRRFAGYCMLPKHLRPKCFRDEYIHRVSTPRVGDTVEVLWQGKFYSHAIGEHGAMGFEGKAWWQATVVAREPVTPNEGRPPSGDEGEHTGDQQYYRAHFLGWEAKWDEWIGRAHMRWPKPLDHNSEHEIDVGDHVEIHLESTRVPSVWMEGKVIRMLFDYSSAVLTPPHRLRRWLSTRTGAKNTLSQE